MATFDDLVFDKGIEGIMHHGASIYFPNGYGASVIFGELINVNCEHPFELAVLKKENDGVWVICYDSPLTDDVINNLTPDMVTELLQKIEAL